MKSIEIWFIAILITSLNVNSNAQVWTTVTQPSVTGVTDLTVANNKLYMSSNYGVFSTSDGIVWDSTSTGMSFFSGFSFSTTVFNINNIMYSGSQAKLYKSTDFGANWTVMTGAAPSGSASNKHRAIYANGNTMITGWSSSPAMRYSSDGGATWTTNSMQGINKNIIELNGSIFIYTLAGIYKTTDLGATVTQLSGGLPTYSGSGGEIININGVLIATVYLFGTYISSDDGVTWTSISSAEGLTSDVGVTFHVDGNTVYLGCAGGEIFKSTDNGSNWTDITGTGINSTIVISSIQVFNGELYAGGMILYKLAIAVGIDDVNKEISYSIYPNPVEDILTISSTDNFENSWIKMYGLSGDLVFEGNLHENQEIDMSTFSNGIYIIEINQGDSFYREKVVKR